MAVGAAIGRVLSTNVDAARLEACATTENMTSFHRFHVNSIMRTTVDLDEDILRTAEDLARETGQSLGRVLSDLVGRGLRPEDVYFRACERIT
jgi:hypothetical protein